MAYETPKYRVEATLDNNVEVRSYEAMLVAEVEVSGDRGQAVSRAFRILAGFIFGDNVSRAKIAMTAPVMQSAEGHGERIAMTAPVSQTQGSGDTWSVSFMMPSEYTLESLPAPVDERVTVRRTKPYRAVALQFSGRHTDSNFGQHLALLDQAVAESGLKTEGGAMLAYYDAPFKPFFLRRNEVMYRLAD